MKNASFFIFFALTVFAATSAEARNFCVQIGTSSNPIEYEEDAYLEYGQYYGNNWLVPTYRRLPGLRYQITVLQGSSQQYYIYGYLNKSSSSSAGCTNNINLPAGTHNIKVFSYGKPIPGSNSTVSIEDENNSIIVHSTTFSCSSTCNTGTTEIKIFDASSPEDNAFTENQKKENWLWYLYAPVAEALYRGGATFISSLPDLKVKFHGSSLTGLANYQFAGNRINFYRTPSSGYRTTIAHEVGHFIHYAASSGEIGANPGYNHNTCSRSNCLSNGCKRSQNDCSHSVNSTEYTRAVGVNEK